MKTFRIPPIQPCSCCIHAARKSNQHFCEDSCRADICRHICSSIQSAQMYCTVYTNTRASWDHEKSFLPIFTSPVLLTRIFNTPVCQTLTPPSLQPEPTAHMDFSLWTTGPRTKRTQTEKIRKMAKGRIKSYIGTLHWTFLMFIYGLFIYKCMRMEGYA